MWPLTSTVILFLFLFVRFMLGELSDPLKNASAIDLLIIPIGHFVAFFLVASILLNKLNKHGQLITKELTISLITVATFTAMLQLFWRSISNGLSSIDCLNNCASTLYTSPGMPAATIVTWLVVLSALTYFIARVFSYKNRSTRKS